MSAKPAIGYKRAMPPDVPLDLIDERIARAEERLARTKADVVHQEREIASLEETRRRLAEAPKPKPPKERKPIPKPWPGSQEAREEHGCTCPVIDNAHGRGWMGGVDSGNGEPLFWVTESCPYHGHTLG